MNRSVRTLAMSVDLTSRNHSIQFILRFHPGTLLLREGTTDVGVRSDGRPADSAMEQACALSSSVLNACATNSGYQMTFWGTFHRNLSQVHSLNGAVVLTNPKRLGLDALGKDGLSVH